MEYSGPTAAWAYKNIEPKNYDRVVLLGPSHHLPMRQVGLTSCQEWATPLGNLSIDLESNSSLAEDSSSFIELIKRADEDEHSLEMHTPYIRKIFNDANHEIQLLPLMIGQVQKSDLKKYANKLMHLFLDPRTLFVISSDFCHWGEDFDYQPILNGFKTKEIFKSIETLDKQGIE